MCLGLATGFRLKDGDKYILHYYGNDYNYVLKETPGGFVLVHDSTKPFGPPLGALPYKFKDDYNFERIES